MLLQQQTAKKSTNKKMKAKEVRQKKIHLALSVREKVKVGKQRRRRWSRCRYRIKVKR